MKTLLTILTCIMVASCKNGGESVEAEISPQPEKTLSAELKNIRLLPDQSSISLDFVITNNTPKPVIIADRWNSWGASQWRIRVTNSDGSEFVFINPQRRWVANFLTVVTIQPKEEFRSRCRLVLNRPTEHVEEVWTFSNEPKKYAINPKVQFSSPLKLVGIFAAQDIHQVGDVVTNWTGSIKTPEVQIEK